VDFGEIEQRNGEKLGRIRCNKLRLYGNIITKYSDKDTK